MPRSSVEEQEPPRRIAPNGNKLPRQLSEGLVVTDIGDRKWKIGKSIGLGGFGEIYLASDDVSSAVGRDAHYVAKVEAHSSGPLFVEMNYYLRAAKREMVDEWVARKDLLYLGMPFYIGSGSCWYKGERFRFLIIPRYSHDLEKTFKEQGRRFHLKTVLGVALQVMDALEYIHTQGYVHADIKASNLLVGLDRDEQDRVFLVDFGLATRFRVEGVHKEFKPDLRKAHDGTLEFTSRDAHQGAHSRRGDLEVLGYNMLQWLCGQLPWEGEDAGTDPEYIHAQKEGFMKDPSVLVRACFRNSHPPAVLEKYLKYVNSLGFETQPDYEYCRKMFRQGLKEAGFKDDGRLELNMVPAAMHLKSQKRGKKRPYEEPENIAKLKPIKVVRISPAQPCRPKNCNTRATRSSPTSPMLRSREPFDWERVLQSNPEKKFYKRGASEPKKSEGGCATPEQRSSSSSRSRNLEELRKKRGLDNPTPAMLQVMGHRKSPKSRTTSGHSTPTKRGRSESLSLPPEEILTPAMEEVIQQRERRRLTQSCSPEPAQVRRRAKKPQSAVHSAPPSLSPESPPTQRRLTRGSRGQAPPVLTVSAQLPAKSKLTRPTSVRPTVLELRSPRWDEEAEEVCPSKQVTPVSETNSKLAKTPHEETRHSPRKLGKRTKPLSAVDQRDQRAQRRALRDSSAEKEQPGKKVNGSSLRLRVLMALDECSSTASSRSVSSSECASNVSGSVYEPSEYDEFDDPLPYSRVERKGWYGDTALRRTAARMPTSSDVERRVTRNFGKT